MYFHWFSLQFSHEKYVLTILTPDLDSAWNPVSKYVSFMPRTYFLMVDNQDDSSWSTPFSLIFAFFLRFTPFSSMSGQSIVLILNQHLILHRFMQKPWSGHTSLWSSNLSICQWVPISDGIFHFFRHLLSSEVCSGNQLCWFWIGIEVYIEIFAVNVRNLLYCSIVLRTIWYLYTVVFVENVAYDFSEFLSCFF